MAARLVRDRCEHQRPQHARRRAAPALVPITAASHCSDSGGVRRSGGCGVGGGGGGGGGGDGRGGSKRLGRSLGDGECSRGRRRGRDQHGSNGRSRGGGRRGASSAVRRQRRRQQRLEGGGISQSQHRSHR
jgi:arginine/serine-rich splicing factor 4/5/6